MAFRDVPACATLNRSCYNSRRQNPYSNYYTSESPYADTRADIYYTSTLTRHPRHSSSRGYPSDGSEKKIYESPSAAQSYHHSGTSTSNISGGNRGQNYGTIGPSVGIGVGMSGPSTNSVGGSSAATNTGPSSQGTLLRLDEPRIYSSSSLQLGANPTSLRSNSPQHFIDRSISLIRLDNGGNNAAASATSSNSGMTEMTGGLSSSTIGAGTGQPRLDRFKYDLNSC